MGAKSKWTVDRTDTERLPVIMPDGTEEWITVLRRLSVGDKRGIQNAAFKGMTGIGGSGVEQREPELVIDWQRSSFARTLSYLKDWSLTDEDKVKLPISPEAIRELHDDVYEAIEAAINKHHEAQEALKKTPAGGPKPPATST